MKTLLTVTTLLALWLTPALAEPIPVVNMSGQVISIDKPNGFRFLTENEKKALDNPGMEVPTGNFVTISRVKANFWHQLLLIKRYQETATYQNDKLQTVQKIQEVTEETGSATYLISGFVALALMLSSNTIMLFLGNSATAAKLAAISSLMAGCLMIVRASATQIITDFGFGCLAAFMALMAAVAIGDVARKSISSKGETGKPKAYLTYSVLFYALVIVWSLL